MWELDYKESWVLNNWCFWTVVLTKTLESPLDCKEIQPVHPKRNQSWLFIGRTDAEAETPIFWPPDAKNWLTGKDPDAGKDWRQEEKGMTEDEMVGWYHWLDGHEFEQALGVGEGQGSLACCSPWCCKELKTEQLNWTPTLLACLAFPWWLLMLKTFSCINCPFVCLLWTIFSLVSLPAFNLIHFWRLSSMSYLYILNINPLLDKIWKYFLLSYRLCFILLSFLCCIDFFF